MINLMFAVVDAEALFKNQARLTNGLYTRKTGYTNKMVLPEYCKYLKVKSDLEQYLCDNMFEDNDEDIDEEFMHIKKIVFTGKSKTGRALLSQKVKKDFIARCKLSYWDGMNFVLSYKGAAYNALKKKHCIREYEISRTNAATGKTKSYTIKLYYTEGSNLAKVKSDVRIPAGEYELEQYVDAEHSEVLKVVVE